MEVNKETCILACIAGLVGFGLGAMVYSKKRELSGEDCLTEKNQSPVKFTYWHGFGRGEKVRSCIAGAGIEFEDIGLTGKEEFLKLKPKLKWDQVPLLEINGLNLVQTGATCRYVGRISGLYTDLTPEEYYQIDCLIDSAEDLNSQTLGFPFVDDEGKKKILQKVENKITERYLKTWNNDLSGKVYFVNEKLTIADCQIFSCLRFIEAIHHRGLEWLKDCPNLICWYNHIQALPQFQKYLTKETENNLKLPFDLYSTIVRETMA